MLPWRAPSFVRIMLLLSVAVLLVAMVIVWQWSRDHWRLHPLARTLAIYGRNWRYVLCILVPNPIVMYILKAFNGVHKAILSSHGMIVCNVRTSFSHRD